MKKLAKRITGKEWGDDSPDCSFYLFLGLSRVRSADLYFRNLQHLLGTPGTELGELWSPALKMMGLSLLAFLTSVTVGFFAARVAASYTAHLRSDIFNRVLDYSQTEIKTFSLFLVS